MTEGKNESVDGYGKVGEMVAAFYHGMLAKDVPQPLAEKMTEIMLKGLVEQIGQNARDASTPNIFNIGAKGG